MELTTQQTTFPNEPIATDAWNDVTTDDPDENDTGFVLHEIYVRTLGMVISILLLWVLVLVVACYYGCGKPKKDRDAEKGSVKTLKGPAVATSSTKADNDSRSYDVYEILRGQGKGATKCIVDEKRLTLGDVIGQGQFGVVYEGTYANKSMINPQKVAVKTAHEKATKNDVTSFLVEGLRMRSFAHSHVLTMLGLVVKDDHPYIILPFMELGDLRSYITDPQNMLTIRHLVQFSVAVADGMCYLSKQGFVHRDLAARNCMLDKDRHLKIADFGLCLDANSGESYDVRDKRPLPIRWMAPECFDTNEFTWKSDVWSYGVLLWELFTRGSVPYSNLTNQSVISYVSGGERLARPPYAPDDVYDLMRQCWSAKSGARPTFQEALERMRDMLMRSVVPASGSAMGSVEQLGVAPTRPS